MSYLPCETVTHNPSDKPIDAAVIWLHGLGANGHDFVPVVPHLGLSDNLAARFIFPHAPSIPVTVNGGYVMPAWYDILELSIDRKIDLEQIQASAQKVVALIQRENERGVPTERIVVAGFSQGGAVAFEAALSYPEKLAGLMALSSYFATKDSIVLSPTNQNMPIFIGHGTRDPVVPEALGQMATKLLQDKGYAPEYHSYPMEHSVHAHELKDIGKWLNAVLI